MWLLIPILIYSIVFLYVRHVYSHWRRNGFPHEKANLGWSFLKEVYKREFHHVEAINEAYQMGKEKFTGIYCLFRPTLIIRDLGLARNILKNSNGHFNDSKWDYVKGYRKYNMLEKLAPMFCQKRLEAMFRNIDKIADYALNHMKLRTGDNVADIPAGVGSNKIAVGSESDAGIDMQQLFRIYSANIISNLIYGLDIDVFKHSDSIFQQYLNNSFWNSAFNSYTLSHLPKRSALSYRLRDIVRENVELREEGGMIRKDILQILVKFRNGNDIEQRENLTWHIENVFDREKVLSIKKLARISEYFMENGVATIASTATFTLYEILQQNDLKIKIQEEIRAMKMATKQLPNQAAQLSFEGVKELKFLDLCIQETVRKYPSVPLIERVCRKDFQLPGSNKILTEGKSFIIPLLAMQRDEKYFENPLIYKPQRFVQDSNGNKADSFIGFGLGADACIARNFVKLVVKLILIKLLQNYQVDLVLPADNLEICYNGTPCIKSKQGLRVKLRNSKIKLDA